MRALSLALLIAAAAVPATAEEISALGWLSGSWRGTGTMMGNASEGALDVRPVLGGRFVELSWRAGRFEGRAFYRPVGDGRWRATWFDNRGISFPIEAVHSNGTLTANWGSAETERGTTIYTLVAEGRLVVTDAVRRPDGTYRVFAEHVLARAD